MENIEKVENKNFPKVLTDKEGTNCSDKIKSEIKIRENLRKQGNLKQALFINK